MEVDNLFLINMHIVKNTFQNAVNLEEMEHWIVICVHNKFDHYHQYNILIIQLLVTLLSAV